MLVTVLSEDMTISLALLHWLAVRCATIERFDFFVFVYLVNTVYVHGARRKRESKDSYNRDPLAIRMVIRIPAEKHYEKVALLSEQER